MVRIMVLFLAAMLGLAGGPAIAQERVADLLPGPEQMGPDWMIVSHDGSDFLPASVDDLFTDAAYVVLAGPAGARITIFAYRTDGDASAIRQSWTETGAQFEGYQRDFDVTRDQRSESALAGLSPPTGCADARRAEGAETTIPSFAVGLTLCASDPNLIVLVFTSGEINGLSGQPAADSIVELVLDKEGS